jgi:hypothetical protein
MVIEPDRGVGGRGEATVVATTELGFEGCWGGGLTDGGRRGGGGSPLKEDEAEGEAEVGAGRRG